jgi:hypothetical protein
MALTAKGFEVELILTTKREIILPKRAAWMHDGDGRQWPHRSILIGPFDKSPATIVPRPDGPTMRWFGEDYEPRLGHVELPPRSLASWKCIGDVKRIYYERPGTRAPGFYKHDFVTFFFKTPRKLYRQGKFLRLEGVTVDYRGIR